MFYFHFIFFNLLAFNSGIFQIYLKTRLFSYFIIHIQALILVFCLNIYLDTYEQLSYKPVQFRRSRELNSHSTTDVKFRSHAYNKFFLYIC